MFQFQISNYNDPMLESEAAELIRQVLEKYSRQHLPGIWKAADALYAHAAKGPGRESRRKEYHIYGVILIALGIFALVPGLMEPKITDLIVVGCLAIAAGIVEFLLVRKRKPMRAQASCRKDAKELLSAMRGKDWTEANVTVTFDESGMDISAGDAHPTVPRDRLTGLFTSEHLYLVLYDEYGVTLLQKKDMIFGEPDSFPTYFCEKTALSDNGAS